MLARWRFFVAALLTLCGVSVGLALKVSAAESRADPQPATYSYDAPSAATTAAANTGAATYGARPGTASAPGPSASVVALKRAAKEGEEAGEIVYRVHGGKSGPHGRSWSPKDPATLENPRGELGLPDVNSGEFVSKARVKDWTGVSGRRALPLDGNPGGAPEYLFPDPLSQLEHIETRPVRPPY